MSSVQSSSPRTSLGSGGIDLGLMIDRISDVDR